MATLQEAAFFVRSLLLFFLTRRMPSLICRICLESLHEKAMVATTCGHIFCSVCASVVFQRGRTPCPVCRKPHTHRQLIRLFPEWDSSEDVQVPVRRDLSAHREPLPDHHPEPIVPHTEVAPITSSPELHVSLDNHTAFPWHLAGEVPAWDCDGTPLYIGTTFFNGGWHPCKITPYNYIKARVSYGGKEYENTGLCYLLPFNAERMEWVPASHGVIPYGRRPIVGGYEEIGEDMFYHALAVVRGVKVPGKIGPHLVSLIQV